MGFSKNKATILKSLVMSRIRVLRPRRSHKRKAGRCTELSGGEIRFARMIKSKHYRELLVGNLIQRRLKDSKILLE